MRSVDAEPSQHVEALLHRGEADVYYRGIAIAGGRVLLEDRFSYGEPRGSLIAEASGVADWWPAR